MMKYVLIVFMGLTAISFAQGSAQCQQTAEKKGAKEKWNDIKEGVKQKAEAVKSQAEHPFVAPGYNYYGPGSRGGEPTSKLDAAAKKHDESYDASHVERKDYIPGGQGHAGVVAADMQLIKDSEKIKKDSASTEKDKELAGAATTYFKWKNDQDLKATLEEARGRKVSQEEVEAFRKELEKQVVK